MVFFFSARLLPPWIQHHFLINVTLNDAAKKRTLEHGKEPLEQRPSLPFFLGSAEHQEQQGTDMSTTTWFVCRVLGLFAVSPFRGFAMRAAILLLACAGGALAFAPQASRSARRSAPLRGKAPKSEDGADAPQRIAEGTVCEWVAEKHRVHVGVVKSSESKSKGGARYEIADASGVVHTVPEKQLR